MNSANKTIYFRMTEELPETVAMALHDWLLKWYAKNGPPPILFESIEVEIRGEVIEIKGFTMKETE